MPLGVLINNIKIPTSVTQTVVGCLAALLVVTTPPTDVKVS